MENEFNLIGLVEAIARKSIFPSVCSSICMTMKAYVNFLHNEVTRIVILWNEDVMDAQDLSDMDQSVTLKVSHKVLKIKFTITVVMVPIGNSRYISSSFGLN